MNDLGCPGCGRHVGVYEASGYCATCHEEQIEAEAKERERREAASMDTLFDYAPKRNDRHSLTSTEMERL